MGQTARFRCHCGPKARPRPGQRWREWADLLNRVKTNLPVFEGAVATQLVKDLAGAGFEGTACLRLLFGDKKLESTNLPEFEGTVAGKLVLDLANAGENGAYCLRLLLEQDKLDLTGAEAAQLVLELANAGPNGAKCLNLLLEQDKLDLTGAEAAQLVLELANAGKDGAACLWLLLDKNKLANLNLSGDEAAQLVKDLANAGRNGVICLGRLINEKLDLTGIDAKDLVLNLATKEYGAHCLARLLEAGKLSNLPEFEGDEATQLVIDLAGAGFYGTDCLRLLFGDMFGDKKLESTNLPDFQPAEAKDFVLKLADSGKYGANYSRRLRDKIPPFDAPDAKALVIGLANKPSGIFHLRQLCTFNKLQNLKLKGIDDPTEVKTKLAKAFSKNTPDTFFELRKFLKENLA